MNSILDCSNVKKKNIDLYRTKIMSETPCPSPQVSGWSYLILLPNSLVQQEIELKYLFAAAIGNDKKGEAKP